LKDCNEVAFCSCGWFLRFIGNDYVSGSGAGLRTNAIRNRAPSVSMLPGLFIRPPIARFLHDRRHERRPQAPPRPSDVGSWPRARHSLGHRRYLPWIKTDTAITGLRRPRGAADELALLQARPGMTTKGGVTASA